MAGRALLVHAHACIITAEGHVRTTIELKDESRAKLLEIAARRGEKGFSRLIDEAVEQYLRTQEADRARRTAALALRGSLGEGDVEQLRTATGAIREEWR
jgi:predicted transcriptional regulator